MGARSLAAALGFVVALTGVCPSALAAPPNPPSAADLTSARKLFESGLKLYNEGSYLQALAAFRRANDIAPRASIQRNIAQCQRDLRDFAAAYDAYQTLLARYGATMSAADKRPIERAIEELALLSGTVHVTVADPGAVVSIDDHDVGTTPLAAPVRINLGPHVVTVTKGGFETIRKEVKIGGGDDATIEGPMQSEITTGHLVVTAPAHARARVIVDGAGVGEAPWEGDVPPGVHVVEARGPDGVAQPKQVEVVRKARVEVLLDLAASAGRVQVDTHTADALIAIDGKPAGRGVWEGMLPPGEHEISIEAAGFRPYKRLFLVHAGESFVEDARLVAEGGGTPTYEGVYSGLSFLGFAAPDGGSNAIAQQCPSTTCASSSPLGAGLAVRVGYAFGWIALEGFALGTYDYSTASAIYKTAVPTGDHAGVARTEDYTFHRFGGGGALGVRVATKHPHVRLTAGALGGVAYMGNIYKRVATAIGSTATQSDEYTGDTTTYTAPLLLLDAGALIGWANGAKLHVALLTMFQFVGDAVFAPGTASRGLGSGTVGTPPLQVAAGTQLFVGPMIGFDFGL